MPISFFGVQLLLNQEYWEKVDESLEDLRSSIQEEKDTMKGIDDGTIT